MVGLLSAEKHHLLDKAVRRNADYIEITACAVVATFFFILVYTMMSGKFRFDAYMVALLLGPVLTLLVCIGATVLAYRKRTNVLINLAVCLWLALAAGYLVADKNFHDYANKYYVYEDMVSYVNVDPNEDQGQSFMDAGKAYFKEGSYVMKTRGVAFHNGDTYCVAPIMREPLQSQSGTIAQQTVNGFLVPNSGTFDFWAVGTNCCGETGSPFTCGEVDSPLSRSGIRLLSDNQRAYYLLGVQQWSAGNGLPVRHPLFFTWVTDPLAVQNAYLNDQSKEALKVVFFFFLCALVVSFILHLFMKKQARIY